MSQLKMLSVCFVKLGQSEFFLIDNLNNKSSYFQSAMPFKELNSL